MNRKVTEEKFCICNELWNLNAFFYPMNPIIRFLMVRHNQLYLKNKTNIPSLYQFVTTYLLTFPKTDITQTPVVIQTPLQSLMISAHEYSQRNFLKIKIDFRYRILLKASNPNIQTLVGHTCMTSRNSVKVALIQLETDKQLFSDSSIESIRSFYEVFKDLHFRIPEITTYVTIKDRENG